MRCYAPSTSAIAAVLLVGYLTVRHIAGHALAGSGGAGLATTVVIVLGCCLLAAGLAVVSATTIRRRRAAAGGCLTCRHPCQEPVTMRSRGDASSVAPVPPAPAWPDRPLTRAALPVAVIPRRRPAGTGGRR